MTTTVTAPSTRTGDLLLVRLLAPAKRPLAPARLRQDLSRLLRQPLDTSHWQGLVDDLTAAGLVSARPLRLTEAGRSRALEVLRLPELPQRADWRTLRDRYLVPVALELPADTGEARGGLQDRDKLGALLIQRRYDLPAGASRTLHTALEALACKQLGFPQETSLTAVRDATLSQLLGASARLSEDQLAPLLVQAAAGSRRADVASLREAVLRDWLEPSAGDGRAGNAPLSEPESFDLSAFAATVRAAARDCPTGRFGDNKVFIHHVWGQLRDEPGIPIRSLEEFKERLTQANHAGLLHLSRADLVQAMDPDDVRQAETRYLDAVFHFVLIERDRP